VLVETARALRALAGAFLLVTVGLFLFFEYWPARLKPYYIPIVSAAGPGATWTCWHPASPLGSRSFSRCRRRLTGSFFHGLRLGLLAAGFGVAGYCDLVRCYEFQDRTSEFRRVTEDRALLEPYLDVPHYLDVDGFGQLRAALGVPKKPELHGNGSGIDPNVLDFRKAKGRVSDRRLRRYGVNGDDAWVADKVRVVAANSTWCTRGTLRSGPGGCIPSSCGFCPEGNAMTDRLSPDTQQRWIWRVCAGAFAIGLGVGWWNIHDETPAPIGPPVLRRLTST